MGLLTTLEKTKKKKKKKKLDHPKKNTWTPLITTEPIKNKIQHLQNFCSLNVEKKLQEMLCSQHFHDIFVTNPK